MPQDGKSSFEETLQRMAGAFAGIKLGPGLIGNLSIVSCAAFLAICVAAWSFSTNPLIAVVVIGAILILTVYMFERLIGFANKNPAAALLGSSELYHHMKEEIGAKNPKVIQDLGLADGTPVTIEHQARRE